MFTGLVAGMGSVVTMRPRGQGAELVIDTKGLIADIALGDSIAINGACLTVTRHQGAQVSFDLSHETLRSASLGKLKSGDRVNVEPSLTPSSKMGGHFVTGHVDAVGRIRKKALSGDMLNIEV